MQRLESLLRLPQNQLCVDCGTRGPRWSSTNLGVFFCMNCSAVHRSLGTHISKVKSCTLDEWTNDQIEYMASCGGNQVFNQKYEAKLQSSSKLKPSASQDERISFIRNKYDRKLWFSESPLQTNSSSRTDSPKPQSYPSAPSSPAPRSNTPSSSSPQGSPFLDVPSSPSSSRSSSKLVMELDLLSLGSPEVHQPQPSKPTPPPPQATIKPDLRVAIPVSNSPVSSPDPSSSVGNKSRIKSAKASILSLFDDEPSPLRKNNSRNFY
ncbi:hypothetical protein RCL1_006832 [Eukaryota sp. TZLM3-RCL]